MSAPSVPPPAWLSMRGTTKSFPGVRALDGVDFDVVPGEVHALVGENGAGKSTLIKVLTGVHRADAGEMRLGGKLAHPTGPIEALRLGVAAIYQEVNVVPALSVAENVFLGRQPRARFGLDWGGMRARARRALARVGLDLDVGRQIGEYPVAVQQRITIARAIDLDARLLVMDEPTSSLDRDEARRLLELARELAAGGLALVFIGHDLDEVFQVADRITVLRAGRVAGTFGARAVSRLELVAHMLGRAFEEARPAPRARAQPGTAGGERAAALEARGLARAGALAPTDLCVAAGEVVGLAGLFGSGRTELVRLLFGADRASAGEVRVAGAPLRRPTPRRCVRAGLALCPEDRREEGIFPSLSVRENLVIVVQRALSRLGLVSRRRQAAIAELLVRRLGIACAGLDQPLRTLSGGNQQKVVLARWIAARPRALLLDDPTRGIDVGAKAEALALVRELAREGRAVLFVSSSLAEVLSVAERVAVLHAGAKVCELDGPDYDEGEVLAAMAGGADRAG